MVICTEAEISQQQLFYEAFVSKPVTSDRLQNSDAMKRWTVFFDSSLLLLLDES